tara:strand:+ start:509 stop:694 length:186 start_codon:yes stop_codon:yes gene_type:complete
MANITIDGKEYNSDDLSENAKQQLASLQYAQKEIQRLQAQIAICQTAAASYSQVLKEELNS